MSNRDASCVAVLRAPTSVRTLADGASVHADDRTAEIRDGAGRLLIRYRDGALELSPTEGDLILQAPRGRVLLRAQRSLELESEGELRLSAEQTELATGRLQLEAKESRVVTGVAVVFARDIATTANRLACNVERYEVEATRIVEKARDAFREITDLAQTRAGRLRTLVADLYTLDSRRTMLRSDDDTSIDGKRVLLG